MSPVVDHTHSSEWLSERHECGIIDAAMDNRAEHSVVYQFNERWILSRLRRFAVLEKAAFFAELSVNFNKSIHSVRKARRPEHSDRMNTVY